MIVAIVAVISLLVSIILDTIFLIKMNPRSKLSFKKNEPRNLVIASVVFESIALLMSIVSAFMLGKKK